MHPVKLLLLVVNVLGGAAVLGSYAHGILTHDNPGAGLWGGVPPPLRPLYTASMLTATAGYLTLFGYLMLRVDTAVARVGPLPSAALIVIFLLILIPSALWMPLTFQYLASPSPLGWAAVRVVLAVVGLASLALILALLRLEGAPGGPWRAAAVVGSVFFAIQTALLDGVIWPALFKR